MKLVDHKFTVTTSYLHPGQNYCLQFIAQCLCYVQISSFYPSLSLISLFWLLHLSAWVHSNNFCGMQQWVTDPQCVNIIVIGKATVLNLSLQNQIRCCFPGSQNLLSQPQFLVKCLRNLQCR